MSGWAERAATAILPHSRAKTLVAALSEWAYTGRFFDSEATDGTCELCGQEDLRYHFEIENRETDASLLVGSECIKRFDIGGIDGQGRRIDSADTGRLVDKHRRGLVEDARKRRVMTALLKLEQKAADFEARHGRRDAGTATPNRRDRGELRSIRSAVARSRGLKRYSRGSILLRSPASR